MTVLAKMPVATKLRVGSAGKCQDSRGADSKRNNGGGQDNQLFHDNLHSE